MHSTTLGQPSLVPEGTRLLHIGPPKTATTAVQGALDAARDDLVAQGVRYVGQRRRQARAAAALTRRRHLPSSTTTPPISEWETLAADINDAREPRVVVSSEFFAAAGTEKVRRVASELGSDRLHIVVTLRPLARILPSRWQQNVQMGQTVAFEDWLGRLLHPDRPDRSESPGAFWMVNRHDALVRRWADVVGPDRVTVIVLDDADRDRVLRAFEAMLGLRPGTLLTPAGPSNRSLSLDEVEAVRAFNIEAQARAVPEDVALSVMFQGAVPFLKELDPLPGSTPIALPDWALDRAASVQREIVDGIASTGVRVDGDLELLARVPEPGDVDVPSQTDIPARLPALMTIGALIGGGLIPQEARLPAAAGEDPAPEVDAVAERIGTERARLGRHRTRLLARALARSITLAVKSRAAAMRDRLTRTSRVGAPRDR
jgi:hypothetical protein